VAKVLTVTPTPGESPEAFAARIASQTEEFFGADNGVPETSTEPTDVSELAPADGEEPAPSA